MIKGNKSIWIALGLLAIVCLWVTVGMLFNKNKNAHADVASQQEVKSISPTTQKPNKPTDKANALFGVEVVNSVAKDIPQQLSISATLEPNRTVVIRAETVGSVAEVLHREGSYVQKGQVIARLNADDRTIRLESANIRLAEAKRNYQAMQSLYADDFIARTKVDEALNNLKLAETSVAQAKLEMQRIAVTAPFNGYLDAQMFEVGDYVSPGQSLVSIVDVNPLVANLAVPQQNIQGLKVGQKVRVMVGDGVVQGSIRFISPKASDATRAYTVEVQLPATQNVKAGASAKAIIELSPTPAHFVSAAQLSLNSEGKTGVKTVENSRVVFSTVEVIKAEQSGIWIGGLSTNATIIKTGQDFVKAGDLVTVTVAKP